MKKPLFKTKEQKEYFVHSFKIQDPFKWQLSKFTKEIDCLNYLNFLDYHNMQYRVFQIGETNYEEATKSISELFNLNTKEK
jgi:hypothetical protein